MQTKFNYDVTKHVVNANQKDLFPIIRAAKNEFLHQEILKNTLFLPQNRPIQKPLQSWIKKLREELKKETSGFITLKYANQIATVFNEAVFIFMSHNYHKQARDICYSQIKMFIDWSDKTDHCQFLQYAFQPWFNLIRIDRLTENEEDAFKKLDILTIIHGSKCRLDEKKYWFHILQKDFDLYLHVLTQSVRERIHLYLHGHYYDELLHFINSKNQGADILLTWIQQEALAIALANQEQFEKAEHCLIQAKMNTASSVAAYIFYLRECELRIFSLKKNRRYDETKYLFQASVTFLENHKMSADHLYIGLQAVTLLITLNRRKEAAKLAYFCLKGAYYIDDDILKTECLVTLYNLIPEVEGKRLIENLMIEHYYHTQYFFARQKMLDSFHDLKYVENKYPDDEITPLFEHLLIFSSCPAVSPL